VWNRKVIKLVLINKFKPLPDIIANDLDILFIGYNPGILSAKLQHHYAHKSNRFWRLLYESGLTPCKFSPEDDRNLLSLNLGSTNIVDRPSKSANEIKKEELIAGTRSLLNMIDDIKPKIACFVGIGVYRSFGCEILGVPPGKMKINTGLQPSNIIGTTLDFVCSNPSGLNTIPIQEQLRCFKELKELLVEKFK
jgi:double-stranded uracil-DNA glycosylase